VHAFDEPCHSRGFESFDCHSGDQYLSQSYNYGGSNPGWRKIPGEPAARRGSRVPGAENRKPTEQASQDHGWPVLPGADDSGPVAARLRRTQFHYNHHGNASGHLHDQRVGDLRIVLANHANHSGGAIDL
jgi:hypothetical protein